LEGISLGFTEGKVEGIWLGNFVGETVGFTGSTQNP
jgi:hypothetical protein